MKNLTEIQVGFTHFDPRFSLFWTIYQYFIRINAARLGVKLIDIPVVTMEEQIAAIESMIAQGVNIILLKPIVSEDPNLTAVLRKARGQGVPIISLDCSAGGASTSTIRSDNYRGQAMLADYMFTRLGGKGKVAYLQGDLKLESAILRSDGFHSALANYPEIDLVYESSLDWAVATSRRAMAKIAAIEALTAHSDLGAIIAASDDSACGAIDAIAEFGLTGKVLVSGFDALPQALVAIKEGLMEATACQALDIMAGQALQRGLDVLHGKSSPPEVTVKVDLVTRDNLAETALLTMQIIPEILDDLVQHGAELQSNASFLETVIDNIPVMLFVKDAENLRYVRINKAREKWLGISRKEQIGKCAYDLYPPELAERLVANDRAVLLEGKPVDISEEIATSAGPKQLHTRKIPIREASGLVSFLLIISEDITERKADEAALIQRAEELEYAYKNLQEHQDKLFSAEKMASLGRLTAGIAHEINTPLATVRTAIAELQKLVAEYRQSIGDPDINDKDHVEIATEMETIARLAGSAAERAAGFIGGVKLQTRELSPEQLIYFDPVPVIQESIMLLGHALRQGNASTEFTAAPEPMSLYGSPGRIAQLITNLITNSIDASAEKGGGLISLSLAPRGTFLELVVSDNGCGIPENVISKVLDPMFTTKPFGKGTGLGLAIVNEVVSKDFHGSLTIESKVGQGTTFSMLLAAREQLN